VGVRLGVSSERTFQSRSADRTRQKGFDALAVEKNARSVFGQVNRVSADLGRGFVNEPGSDAIILVVATAFIHNRKTPWQERGRVDFALSEGAIGQA
jgi:hypothetical protein